MDDFYRDYILDHYRNPRNFGTLEHSDVEAEDLNPLCGDEIRMQLKLDDGVVTDVRFSGKGCAISQASASMLTETVKGMKLSDVAKLPKDAVLDAHSLPKVKMPNRDGFVRWWPVPKR